MTPNRDEFAKRMLLLAEPAERFRPAATYDQDGDCIEFLLRPDAFYAERVDDLVTVYYSQETGEVVGSLIKGVRGFCDRVLQRLPGFVIEIQDGRMRLAHLFRARLWEQTGKPSDVPVLTYRKLLDAAEESNVETENFTLIQA